MLENYKSRCHSWSCADVVLFIRELFYQSKMSSQTVSYVVVKVQNFVESCGELLDFEQILCIFWNKLKTTT